jgi:hypothetical protein
MEQAGAKAVTSTSFARALAGHFGLRYVLSGKVNDKPDEVFGATITLALTAEDVEAIGRRMAEANKG